MRPVDQFRRTPPRRYTQSRQAKTRGEEARIRKRYFDLPDLGGRRGRNRVLRAAGCALLLLLTCRSSGPFADVPDVQARFADWAQRRNEEVVQELPGATPEPGSALYEALEADRELAEMPAATPVPAATQAPAFKQYAAGDLAYHTGKLDIDITQKQKKGITYFVCDIRLTDASQLRTAFAGDDFRSGIYEATSDIAARYDPVLAINADFCRYHRNGVIIRNGELLRKQNIQRHHLLIIDEKGDMSALTDRSGKQGAVADRLAKENTWQTFEFGPVLVENGQAAELPSRFYVNCHDGYYEPRTAIGQMGPLHYIVIVVDGRRDGYSTGASIPQLQQLFLDEGAQFAFNLDGGGSTSLYFLGRVVNMPSGGKERSVSDVIMFMGNPVPRS